jgi:hypothetical protein
MNGLRREKEHEVVARLRSLYAHRRWWTKLKAAISEGSPKGVVPKGVAPLLARRGRLAVASSRSGDCRQGGRRRHVEPLAQSLGRAVPELEDPERIDSPRGEMSDVVRDVQQEVETGRARHGRRKQ